MSAPKYTKHSQSQKPSNTITHDGARRPSRTPLCAYCKSLNQFGHGLPTDHWLRESPDPKSPVTCPILRWEECSWCGLDGHTKKYCADFICYLESKKKPEKESAVFIEQKRKVLEEQRRQPNTELEKEDEDSGEEDTAKEETVKEDTGIITETEFPVLSGKPVSSSKPTSQSASVWGKFTKK